MATARRFDQFDVFSAVPLKGNPLAVVHAAQGLSDATMAAFARWTNLSETTFLLPPDDPAADYRVRIFTPAGELPFAGHPTLGSCHAWLAAGGVPRDAATVVQECGVGLVRVRVQVQMQMPMPMPMQTQTQAAGDSCRLAFAAPPLRRGGPLPDDEVLHLAAALGIGRDAIVAAAWCDNGPGWRGVLLDSVEQLLALRPDAALVGDRKIGVVAPYPAGGPCAFEVRAFFPTPGGLLEDPVTGSLNASLAQWLMASGVAPPRYVASQGTALGRDGRVFVEQQGADIWIGGDVAGCIIGTVTL